MRYIRRKFAAILAALILVTIPASYAKAESNIIYQTSTKENITSGATLEKITRFTASGWFNINVLRVDLSNPNIQVDTLTNTISFKNLTTVENLAKSRGAVAAVNSSFFSWGEAGSGYADGPIIESGKIISAVTGYNAYNDSMGSFSINNQNQILYDFWNTDINLVTSNGATIPVAQFNKPSKNYNDFTIFDRRWSSTSIGVSNSYPDINEVVVDGGVITDIRLSQPAVEIPQNGYVIITRQPGIKAIADNFRIGDSINLSINTTPDWSSMKMALTGGAILVKDGKIPSKFSVNIPGKNPRTAIGSTQDGSQLILVTVDGNENSRVGLDQTDLAKLMLELGAYNALNFDGGGSTTMVARHTGDSDVSLINDPSDGAQRRVAAGFGIFTLAPPSALDGFVIDTNDDKVFVNTSMDFTVKGYDRYFNPITVDPGQVTWSVSGVQGSFTGNTFYPKTSGTAKIKAVVGNISSEYSVNVLGSPVELTLNTKSFKLPLNGSRSFSVTGESGDGYSTSINPKDVNWTVKGNVGSFNSGTFTASGTGTGYIDASIGNTHAYCAVTVASNSSSIIDDFEQSNGSFVSSPADLGGAYGVYSDEAHSGSFSGKLTYDFTDTAVTGTRAAYMVYPNNGLKLDHNTVKLGLWVYNTHANPNWLRAEVYDSKGDKQYVEFTRNMDWTGWKYLEASLQNIDSPERLARMYIVQVNQVYDSGDVYFDDLTQISSSYPAGDIKAVPQGTVYNDPANTNAAYQNSSSSLRFAVLGQSAEPKNLLEKLLTLKFSEKVNSTCDAALLLGSSSHQISKLIKKPSISTNTGYKSFDIKNSRFIQLDMSKSGLRLSNTAQWNWFFNQLNFSGDNIFVSLAGSPDNFTDAMERKLFKDTLTKTVETTGKNVWVMYKGKSNSSHMENGVKYLETAGYDVGGLKPNNTSLVKFLFVTVNGKNVTYEFKE